MKKLLLLAALAGFLQCAHSLTVTSTTHPAPVFYDFSTEAVPFKAFAVPGGVQSGARFETKNGVLHITNAYAGSFGIDSNIPPFDAEKASDIFFDYKLAPDVKINFFFRIKSKYHAAVFSGPERVRPGGVWLGKMQNIKADNQWHRAHIPLRDWLRRLYPLDAELKVEQIIIGNWDNEGFLMAGIGGNGVGASWSLDNLAITGAGPREAKLQIKDEASLDGFMWALDRKDAVPLPGAELSLIADDGFHLVQIKDKTGRAAASFPLFIAGASPQVGDARLEDNALVVPIQASAGLQAKGLKLQVGEREFDLSSPFLTWDGATGVLRLNAARAGLNWKEKERVPVKVSGVLDLQGRAVPNAETSVTVDFQQHKSAPPRPRLFFGDQPAQNDTFEVGFDGWEKKNDDGAIVERDDTDAANGKYSLRLTSPGNATEFGTWVRRQSFDAASTPLVSFHYRVLPPVRVDFQVSFEGKVYSIGFTDGPESLKREKPPAPIGKVEDVQADGKWHRGEFDLLAMLKKLKPDAASYKVDWLALADGGWRGNYNGAQYWIDDFQRAPAIAGEMKVRVELDDVTGLQGIAWVMDENPATEPPRTANGQNTITASGQGRCWLHVRAQNGAGQWSEALHFPVILTRNG